ncbi:MAG: sugar-binding domain-containing protein [Verrucomicrobiota bacterium]
MNVGDASGAEAAVFADTDWKQVTLPYAWNEDSAFKVKIRELPIGVAWYRKHFKLPAGSEGKKVFLEFEGIRQGGEFYLNGEWIGNSGNGVMAFGFDITDKVKPAPQENVIAAQIDNTWDYRDKETDTPLPMERQKLLREPWRDEQKCFSAHYRQASPDAAALLEPRHNRRLRLCAGHQYPGQVGKGDSRGAGEE